VAQPAEVPPDVRAGEESLLSAPSHLNLPFNGQVAIIRKGTGISCRQATLVVACLQSRRSCLPDAPRSQ
jgi:hypothetical protein